MVASITPAYAYLDPGTGSMLLQGLIAGVAATMAAGSLYWAKVKSYFSRKAEDQTKDDLGK
ncbi:hypothetical protein GN330_21315 [Nitratireductor sp. CAU 1489]|uniref:Uncharacterized protein n=2 Tax=Nitratireductor arenosus TaxID=2682096 RepID=A0A844QKJ7_9HYPH|nr:hypothetical protein [Nitratireductor arenosus]